MDTLNYMKISKFLIDLVSEPNGPSDIILRMWRARFANVFIDSDWDIQICHYSDLDCENNIDWGGVCEISDLEEFMQENANILSDEKAKEFSDLIFEKNMFIYQLCLN